MNEGSVLVGEAELEIEWQADGDGGLKGLVDPVNVSWMDHGAETVSAVSEVFDGVAENFFGMAAEGDVIGDGVPVEEDLTGGHDGGFVARGPFCWFCSMRLRSETSRRMRERNSILPLTSVCAETSCET